jgi:hypothetical protein
VANALILSKKEAEMAERVARVRGITRDEAAELILKGGIAHMVKKSTGKNPAKVYSIKTRKKI